MGLSSSRYTTPLSPPPQNTQVLNLVCEVKELQKQVESLKEMNKSLENQLAQQSNINSVSLNKKRSRLAKLSEKKIDEFVKEILQNKNINIKYFPDFVEEKIYKNIFTILVNLLDHLIDTTSIQLLGHEINFDFAPEDQEVVPTDDDPMEDVPL